MSAEYKVVIYREPLLGSIFLGGSRVNPAKYTDFLNQHARQGWRVITMERETRREFLLFKREAFLTILERTQTERAAPSPASPAVGSVA